MEKAAVWPDFFRASHTIGPDFLLPLGLFNKNEWVMRHCVMPWADDMLCIWKIRNCWLLKKWNWEKKMKLLWKGLLCMSFHLPGKDLAFLLFFQCSCYESRRKSRSFPFNFKESNAPVVPLNLQSRSSPAGRGKLGEERGQEKQSHNLTKEMGWRSNYLFCKFCLVLQSFNSSLSCWDPASLPLTAAAGQRGTWGAGNRA